MRYIITLTKPHARSVVDQHRANLNPEVRAHRLSVQLELPNERTMLNLFPGKDCAYQPGHAVAFHVSAVEWIEQSPQTFDHHYHSNILLP